MVLTQRIVSRKELPIEVLLVQLLVLVFTGVLWWIARRDLAARVPPPVPPGQAADTAELEQLCATLETLVTSLARRLDAAEAAQAAAVQARNYSSSSPVEAAGPVEAGPIEAAMPERQAEPDPRYAPVYALLVSGVSDPIEIARQTGLGRGEVDLILSLRGRRAL